MENLKPCPFCGAEAYFLQTAYGTDQESACLHFTICCKKCRAKAPNSSGKVLLKITAPGDVFAWVDDRGNAIKAWNRRASDGKAD